MNNIGTEEAEYIFPSLANSIRTKVKLLNDIKSMSKTWDDCSKLRQLADRTNNTWFVIQSLLILQSAHFSPESEPWKYLSEATQMMIAASPQERSNFVLDGQSIVPYHFMLYGIALFTAGQYEESERMWNQGRELALADPSARMSCEMLQIRFHHTKYVRIYTISNIYYRKLINLEDAERIRKLTRFDPISKHFTECGYGLALVYSNNEGDQLQGVALIEAYLAKFGQGLTFIWVAPLVLKAFCHVGLIDRGLEIANTAIEGVRRYGLMLPLVLPEVNIILYKC
jgi:hypothetical protein